MINQHLAPNLETVFLIAKPKYSMVSSSMVKEIVRYDGDFKDLVHPLIARALSEKIKK